MIDATRLTDSELAIAIEVAHHELAELWQAWEVMREAGETDLWHPAFQAHQAASREIGPLLVEQYRREMRESLKRFAPPPLSGPEWDRAWREGPGSDAL